MANNVVCFSCSGMVDKDSVGLNKKLLGRKNDRFLCITCLAEYFETTEEMLREKIEQFKEQGCSLFL